MGKIRILSAAELFENVDRLKRSYSVNATEILKMTIENALKKAEAKLTEEMGAKQKNFEAKYAGSTWWEMAIKLYPITQNDDGEFVVTSEAREWEEEKTWLFRFKSEAYEKVERLVRWLDDNRKRGFGDRDADIVRITDNLNAVAA